VFQQHDVVFILYSWLPLLQDGVLWSYWRTREWPPTLVFQQHDVVFILYSWLPLLQDGVYMSYKHVTSTFLQQLCIYAYSYYLSSNFFICWSFNEVVEKVALFREIPFPLELWLRIRNLTLQTYIFFEIVGLWSPNPTYVLSFKTFAIYHFEWVLPWLFFLT
jgi:hypothetical protein